MTDNLKYLKKISLFASLKKDQLKEIEKLIIERKYQKGRIIFMEGEPGEAIYFLKSGRVKITKQSEDGREHILHFINPGEVFAEVVLFDDKGYPATAEVIENAEVGLIKNRDMEKIILNNSGLALIMLKIMARRLRLSQQQINELALMDATRRLAATLLQLAKQHGVQQPDKSLKIDLTLTNQELANLIGTSRETANRILSDFRRQKIIALKKQYIFILDNQKLNNLSK